jgi:hypothetical protein
MMMYDDPGSLVHQSRSVEEVVEKAVCTVDCIVVDTDLEQEVEA